MSEQSKDKNAFALSRKRIVIWIVCLLLLTSIGKLVAYEILGASELRDRIGQRVVFPSSLLKEPTGLTGRVYYLKRVKYRMNTRLGFFDLELNCESPQETTTLADEIAIGLSPRETLDLLIVTNKLAGLEPEQFLAQNPIPIVAHRGASKDAPENTLPAFEKAWLQGADAIEGDFHLTADNEIVCVHDANIRHYTQKNIEVKNLTLAELKKLDFGRWHDKQFTGTKIPTFKEVIATIPTGKRIFIEIKSDAKLVPPLIKQIRNSSLKLDQIVIISFRQDVIKAVEDKWPELKTFWLTRFKANENGELEPRPRTVLRTLESLGTNGLSTHFEGLTSELVKSFQKAGYEYHVWTVDEIPQAKMLVEIGVQSITTNVPQKIGQAIQGSSK